MNGRESRCSPNLVGRRLDDNYFLVHLVTNRIYELNATAARVWELLDEGLDRDEIDQRLTAEYDAEPQRVTHEVDALVGQLRAAGLIDDPRVDETPAPRFSECRCIGSSGRLRGVPDNASISRRSPSFVEIRAL